MGAPPTDDAKPILHQSSSDSGSPPAQLPAASRKRSFPSNWSARAWMMQPRAMPQPRQSSPINVCVSRRPPFATSQRTQRRNGPALRDSSAHYAAEVEFFCATWRRLLCDCGLSASFCANLFMGDRAPGVTIGVEAGVGLFPGPPLPVLSRPSWCARQPCGRSARAALR